MTNQTSNSDSQPAPEADLKFRPTSDNELVDWLKDASERPGSRIKNVGGNTASHCGIPASTLTHQLVTSELSRVVDYAKNDMTITVQAALQISELEELLNKEGQTLPIVVPNASSATVGGAIAANAIGSLGFSSGTWRDYLLGMTAVNGRGELIHAGGRVVKNVAGYDLNKVMVGSLGMLCVLTEVTLQVKPLSERSAVLCFGLEDTNRLSEVLGILIASEARPASIDLLNRKAVSATDASFLNEIEDKLLFCVGFQGFSADVEWQLSELEAELASASLNAVRIEGEGHRIDLWQSIANLTASHHRQNSLRIDVPTSKIQALFENLEESQLIGDIDAVGFAGTGAMFIHFDDQHAEKLKHIQKVMSATTAWKQEITFTAQHASPTVIEQSLWPFFRVSESNRSLIDGMLNAFDPHRLFCRERYGLEDLGEVAT